MRGTLSLILAGSCLAILPLLGPAGTALSSRHAGTAVLCAAPDARVMTAARDWMGSLQGWSDSPLLLTWRNLVASSKGTEAPAACRH
ncbi:hypothetical protein [Roseococcus sp. YIM B11640]|uniref:hypothetical protein n=1 Tax=Roseococcus sp. YIM B11640 TaxID=3133973 RepID=UPI003C7E6835